MICTILMYFFLFLGFVFLCLALRDEETLYMALCVIFFVLAILILMSKLI